MGKEITYTCHGSENQNKKNQLAPFGDRTNDLLRISAPIRLFVEGQWNQVRIPKQTVLRVEKNTLREYLKRAAIPSFGSGCLHEQLDSQATATLSAVRLNVVV